MLHVRKLVGEDTLDLSRLEALPEPTGDGNHGVLGAAARREGVRHVGVDDGHARFGDPGCLSKPLDHGMQLWRLILLDDLRAEALSAILSDVKYWRSASPAMIAMTTPSDRLEELEQDDEEHDIERTQQERCEDHPPRQTGVATVCLALHRTGL